MALVAAAIVWFIFKRMRLGYEARAVGASPGSALAGGISIGKVQIRLFLLSGALAGMIGVQQLFADQGFLPSGYEAGIGFLGIGVAFLGQNNPAGIVFAAILWGILARGETSLQLQTDVPREFVIILQGILILSVVVTYQVARRRLFARELRRAAEVEDLGGRRRRRRHRGPREGGPLMFGDLGAALGLAFTYFTIIYVTGLGGLYSERSGIVNIGLEGMMIIGTVTGSWGTFYFTTEAGWGLPWGPIMGILVGMICGALFASIHALATVTFKVDQIVSGVVINLVAVGLARFLSTIFFGQATQSDSGQPHLHAIDIPGLSSLPLGLGRAFTGLSPMVIVAFLLVFPVTYSLYKTRWGLRLRSCGENPEAAPVARRARGAAPVPGRDALGRARRVRGGVPGRRGQPQLERGADARPRVHRARRVDPVQLEPEAPDGGGDDLRLRAGDPVPARRRADHPPDPAGVHPHDALRRHDRGAGGVRRQGATAGGRGQGVRGRRRAVVRLPAGARARIGRRSERAVESVAEVPEARQDERPARSAGGRARPR